MMKWLFSFQAMISAFCSMLQNQAAVKRVNFTDFKANHEISYAWKNNSILDLLSKKKKKFENQTCDEIFMNLSLFLMEFV